MLAASHHDNDNNNNSHQNQNCYFVTRPPPSALSWNAAIRLQPPVVTVTDHGEAEGAEWWLQHEHRLQDQ
jgi:hypothetical protein